MAGHSGLELAFVSSRELDGQRVSDHNPDFAGDLRYENLDPEAAAGRGVDAVVLALPNGKSAPFVAAFDALSPIAGGGEGTSTTGASAASTSGKSPPHPSPLPREQGRGSEVVIVDLSADYRFDRAVLRPAGTDPRRYAGQRRVANQAATPPRYWLAITPLKDVLAGRRNDRCLRLFGRRHHTFRQERRGKAARQPDALQPDRPHPRTRSAPDRPAGGIHAACGTAFPRHHDDAEPVAGRTDEPRAVRAASCRTTAANRW